MKSKARAAKINGEGNWVIQEMQPQEPQLDGPAAVCPNCERWQQAAETWQQASADWQQAATKFQEG